MVVAIKAMLDAAAPPGAVRRFAGSLASAGLFTTAMAASAAAQSCPAGVSSTPILFDAHRLATAKAAVDADARSAPKAAYERLVADADAALEQPARSVMDKERPGDSGDKHDYVSLAPYWWPDASSEDGKPYKRRDGEQNPERNGVNFDRSRMQKMSSDTIDLSLAAVLTGDERYAAKAEENLKVWFLDEATKMNANLEYAQQIPGRNNGRAIGIIDATSLTPLTDATLLLHNAGMLSDETMLGIRQWFGAYAAWLITSEFGQEERAAKNNHGTHYDAQLATFLVLGGRCDLAKRVLNDTRLRLDRQIDDDGFQPLEVTRTRSMHYHAYNGEAFLRVALIAELLGEDLYTWEVEEGEGSLEHTAHLLAGYAGRAKSWPYKRIDDRGPLSVWRFLMQTRLIDDDDPIVEKALRNADRDWADEQLNVTAYKPVE